MDENVLRQLDDCMLEISKLHLFPELLIPTIEKLVVILVTHFPDQFSQSFFVDLKKLSYETKSV